MGAATLSSGPPKTARKIVTPAAWNNAIKLSARASAETISTAMFRRQLLRAQTQVQHTDLWGRQERLSMRVVLPPSFGLSVAAVVHPEKRIPAHPAAN